jgi:hypothetical protein
MSFEMPSPRAQTLLVALMLGISLDQAQAQSAEIGRIFQRGNGGCSNIVNNGGTVNATCVNLPPEAVAQVLKLLAAKGLDGDQAARRLEADAERFQAFTKPEVTGLNKEASELAKRGRFKEAESIYKEMLGKQARMNPTQRASLHFALGSLYELQSSFASAKNEYRTARDLIPSSAEYCIAFAAALLDTGESERRASDRADYNECVRRFRKLASEQPSRFEEDLYHILDTSKFFYDYPEILPYIREEIAKAEALTFRDPVKFNPYLLQATILMGGVALEAEAPDSWPPGDADTRPAAQQTPAEQRQKRDNDRYVALHKDGLSAALTAARVAKEIKPEVGSIAESQKAFAPLLVTGLWQKMRQEKIAIQVKFDVVPYAVEAKTSALALAAKASDVDFKEFLINAAITSSVVIAQGFNNARRTGEFCKEAASAFSMARIVETDPEVDDLLDSLDVRVCPNLRR